MGQKYVADGTTYGVPIVFYDSFDSPVPEGVEATEITEEQWQECISNPGYTLQNGKLIPPSAEVLLARAKAVQKSAIDRGYNTSISADVTFTTEAKVTKTYAADPTSRASIATAAQSYAAIGAVPPGYYWKAVDGTEVPFTLQDLQDLNEAVTAQVWYHFQQRSTLKTQVNKATKIADVQKVTWAS
jgi:Domain of unknown function (DUF4376)